MDIGIDVGGTFTDLVALDRKTGSLKVAKVPATTADQSQGFMEAIDEADLSIPLLSSIVHGSTVAINALLERKGCNVGLVTSRGFRDVLELRRRDRPTPFGLRVKWQPLIPRHRRLEITSRIDAKGQVVETPTDEELAAVVAGLREQRAEAAVISLFNGYRNAAEERRLAERLVALGWPADRITVATDISQEIREFERSTTAAINAYVQPVMANYLTRLADRLEAAGFRHDLLVAQSNGGAAHWKESASLPVNSVMSGPAAGALAAAIVASGAGYSRALACDIGGTSCDISLIRDGLPSMRAESELEFGLPIRRPIVDVRSIGAGGGSIAWIDRGGILRVGPTSAGANPGPASYGRGGEEPTVTDAQLVLGRLAEGMALGTHGGISLDRGRAVRAVEERIARPMGLAVEDAAEAIIKVVEQHMAAALRKISTERGHDPRNFALVMFGGGGPIHTCSLMHEMMIGTAVIPAYPGATSALGCLSCDLRQDNVQSVDLPLHEAAMAEVRAVWRRQEAASVERVRAAGVELSSIETHYGLSCCYQGQGHSLELPVMSPHDTWERLLGSFTKLYKYRYGLTLDDFPVVITAVRLAVRGVRPTAPTVPFPRPEAAPSRKRQARLGSEWRDVAVLRRWSLKPNERFKGPAIIEQSDTTIWIEPGFSAEPLADGSLLIRAPS